MSSPSISYQRLAGAALLGCLVALVLASGLSIAHAGTPASPSAGQLQQQISAGQNQVSELSGTVDAAGGKITALSGSIASLQEQIAQTQTGLYARRAVLLRLRDQSDAAQAHLARLQSAERAAQATLGQQLVGMYEGDAPDVVSVVLESSGFSNMLDRLAFLQKVDKQDAMILSQVQASRRTVAAQATTLAALSVQQQSAALDVLNERNRLASAKLALVEEQAAVAGSRDQLGRRLVGARNRVASVRRQLAQLEAPVTASGGGGGVARRTVHLPRAQERRRAAGHLDARRRCRHRRPERDPRAGRLLRGDRPPRHRRLRAIGAGPALRQSARRPQLRLLRPRRRGPLGPGRHSRPAGPGHLGGRRRHRRHLHRPPPRARLRRLQRLPGRPLQRRPDDVAAARLLLTPAAGPPCEGAQAADTRSAAITRWPRRRNLISADGFAVSDDAQVGCLGLQAVKGGLDVG